MEQSSQVLLNKHDRLQRTQAVSERLEIFHEYNRRSDVRRGNSRCYWYLDREFGGNDDCQPHLSQGINVVQRITGINELKIFEMSYHTYLVGTSS